MRLGVPVADVLDVLAHGKVGNTTKWANGDIRRIYKNDKCSVVVSIRDNKIIQTNPR